MYTIASNTGCWDRDRTPDVTTAIAYATKGYKAPVWQITPDASLHLHPVGMTA